MALLEIQHLTKHFPTDQGLAAALTRKERKIVHAACDVSFTIQRGETVGLVGESGSGKSTIGRCILRLLEPTEGKIQFDGQELTGLKPKDMRKARRNLQMIFQDPFSSLNPRIKVWKIIGHMLQLHGLAEKSETRSRVAEILQTVGLSPEQAENYPHQFSGGQKQRIAIARAIAVEPAFIVADEPVSALDISIRSQVLNLLEALKAKYRLTYLLIAHDLAVVQHMSDRVMVMYLGKIVESGPTEELFNAPVHPYTQALISAVPLPDPRARRNRIVLEGEIPSSITIPSGCRFSTRCPRAMKECSQNDPEFKSVGKEHYAACFLIP